jgi:putative transposase
MELDWLKKVWDQPVEARQGWLEPDDELAVSRQCQLLKVTRSVVYEQKQRLLKEVDESELILLKLLDEEYTRHPFHGSRRMKLFLKECGYSVNRKRVQRLMQQLDRGRERLSSSPPSEPGVQFSRDGLSSQLFPHRDWRANLWASDIVNSPRSAKKAFGHCL